MEEKPDRRRRSRGIYLLPNLLTTATLFSGFYAITAAINGRYEIAAISILVAMVMDGMDGRVARMTNTQSEFGAQYDSLADMLAFAIAPALVMYVWSLSALGKLGWFAAFVHAAGGALRLARFNTQIGIADKRYFQGLASPAAAALIAGFIWVAIDYEIAPESLHYWALLITLLTGLLMVSDVRYHSFKEIDFRGKVPFFVAIAVMLGFAIIFTHPPVTLFVLFAGYAASGPVLTFMLLRKHRRSKTENT